MQRFLDSVPGEPPGNVRGQSNSSTSILVEWDLPRQEVLYGILRGFRIRYIAATNANIPRSSVTTRLTAEEWMPTNLRQQKRVKIWKIRIYTNQ